MPGLYNKNVYPVVGVNGVGKSTVLNAYLQIAPEGSVVYNAAELMLGYLGLENRKQLELVSPSEKEIARTESVLQMIRENADRPIVFLDTHMMIGIGEGEKREYHETWSVDFTPHVKGGIFLYSEPEMILARKLRRGDTCRTQNYDLKTISQDQLKEYQLFRTHIEPFVKTVFIHNQEGRLNEVVQELKQGLGNTTINLQEGTREEREGTIIHHEVITPSWNEYTPPRYSKER